MDTKSEVGQVLLEFLILIVLGLIIFIGITNDTRSGSSIVAKENQFKEVLK